MTAKYADYLEWKEYQAVRYAPGTISEDVGNALYGKFREQVTVEFPTPKTGGEWEFVPQGWVGTIPVTNDIAISIAPKAPLSNVFRMWEYAYRLKGFRFLDGVVGCQSLEDFYQNLASVLAKRVLDRARRGLYRTYLGRSDALPYVSGRLDVRRMASTPWRVNLHCAYEEHTADVEENQILCWTLSVIARSGLCGESVVATVRRAYRELLGCAAPVPFLPEACVGRLYNRLNEDYEPLHGLCRFFLEHRGPHHAHGERAMMPFLVNMARLYELFVAEWLRLNLPPHVELKAQHTLRFGDEGELEFRVDLLLVERSSGKPLCVLDTKYKVHASPTSSDIHEVRSHADALGCTEAILVYPVDLAKPLDATAGSIRVRTLSFRTDGDLDAAGESFLGALMLAGGGSGNLEVNSDVSAGAAWAG
ncbi:MAG: hypothetical protein P1P84_15760 [Deferrisomatales bacterium]|nr:hypothetical protein [Deferrisomatales bacterium]